jgi:hypothetical protein
MDLENYIEKSFKHSLEKIETNSDFQRGVEFAIKFLHEHTDEIHREYLLSQEEPKLFRQSMAISGDILDVVLGVVLSTFPSRDPGEGECAF